MQNFKYMLIFLFGFTFAALIWGIGLLFLKKEPVFYIPSKKDYSFYSIHLTNIFFNSGKIKHIKTLKAVETLKGVKLKAIYFNGKKGFIIIEVKGKTFFVDLGKSYKGYKLVEIGKNYAVFEKNNKKYKIEMAKEHIKNSFSIKNSNTKNKIVVARKTFNEYINNFNKIWQNIGIVKINKGYIITYIKPHSIFEKIGLKKGDILLEVNGRKLKSDADAWDLYKHAKDFDSFEIKILRNNKKKVLYYEMD
jgi:type II secretion system protein C